MTIQKQVDNLIDWYAQNKPSVKQIVLACSRSSVSKFAPCSITYKEIQKRGGVVKKRIYGERRYRDYKIVLARKSDPLYKQQADAFQSVVRGG